MPIVPFVQSHCSLCACSMLAFLFCFCRASSSSGKSRGRFAFTLGRVSLPELGDSARHHLLVEENDLQLFVNRNFCLPLGDPNHDLQGFVAEDVGSDISYRFWVPSFYQ